MEESEFEHIVRRLRPLVTDISGRFFSTLKMDDETEDVAQEVFIQLWRMRDQLGEIRNIEGWTSRITKNKCVSRYRQSRRYELRRIDDYEFTGGEPATKTIENEEEQALLQRLINTLPKSTRRILYMRNVEGMTLDEIATVCNRPKSSVKSSVTTAKRNILKLLKKQR